MGLSFGLAYLFKYKPLVIVSLVFSSMIQVLVLALSLYSTIYLWYISLGFRSYLIIEITIIGSLVFLWFIRVGMLMSTFALMYEKGGIG
jgi:hypothetical protein